MGGRGQIPGYLPVFVIISFSLFFFKTVFTNIHTLLLYSGSTRIRCKLYVVGVERRTRRGTIFRDALGGKVVGEDRVGRVGWRG